MFNSKFNSVFDFLFNQNSICLDQICLTLHSDVSKCCPFEHSINLKRVGRYKGDKNDEVYDLFMNSADIDYSMSLTRERVEKLEKFFHTIAEYYRKKNLS